MTMRAAIERNTATGTDQWGNPVAPSFASIGAPIPCFVSSSSRRQAVGEMTDGKKTIVVEDLRAIFPLGSDVQNGDEIVSVTDRQGTTLINGRLRIDGTPERRHRHLEASLERIS